jgi:hypothetical protein
VSELDGLGVELEKLSELESIKEEWQFQAEAQDEVTMWGFGWAEPVDVARLVDESYSCWQRADAAGKVTSESGDSVSSVADPAPDHVAPRTMSTSVYIAKAACPVRQPSMLQEQRRFSRFSSQLLANVSEFRQQGYAIVSDVFLMRLCALRLSPCLCLLQVEKLLRSPQASLPVS